MNVIDEVLRALNAHDLDAFLACYAPDATIEDGHDNVLARGHDELRARYGQMFAERPDSWVEGFEPIEVGQFVVQEEVVSHQGGLEDLRRHVAVYLVRDGVIVRERLIA